MVSALVEIGDDTNRLLNVVKAKHSLKDKGEAIAFVVAKYAEQYEPELREQFVQKIKQVEKRPAIKVQNLTERYGLGKHVRSRNQSSTR